MVGTSPSRDIRATRSWLERREAEGSPRPGPRIFYTHGSSMITGDRYRQPPQLALP
ncbi:hypothetical protein HBB16_01940 [Pseudonocardia sp. MCCB 268]|nr:hypothetical protein [Pseudonocardia cytotoxica]